MSLSPAHRVMFCIAAAALVAAAPAEARKNDASVAESASELRDDGATSALPGTLGARRGVAGKRRLAMTVTFADEDPVLLVIPDGDFATYRSFRHGESFSIRARLDEESGAVEVELAGLEGEWPAYRSGRAVERLQGRAGFELVGTTPAALPIGITVEPAGEDLAAAEGAGCRRSDSIEVDGETDEDEMLIPLNQGTTCCVACNGGEWCGCRVWTRCGGCTGC